MIIIKKRHGQRIPGKVNVLNVRIYTSEHKHVCFLQVKTEYEIAKELNMEHQQREKQLVEWLKKTSL